MAMAKEWQWPSDQFNCLPDLGKSCKFVAAAIVVTIRQVASANEAAKEHILQMIWHSGLGG
jgi:hypothetical protein